MPSPQIPSNMQLHSMTLSLQFVPLLVATTVLYIFGIVAFIQKKTRKDPLGGSWLSELRGPRPSSWMAGTLNDLIMNDNIGDTDQAYVKEFGLAFKTKAVFGSNMLYLADPRALHYVLDTQTYTFHRNDSAETTEILFGPNILGVEGAEHARQRKVLLLGFHSSSVKESLPAFLQVSQKIVKKWDALLEGNLWSVIDVHSWFSRAALDAIGFGVFSYDFGALGDAPSAFLNAYLEANLLEFKPNSVEMMIGILMSSLPKWFLGGLQALATKKFKVFMKEGKKLISDIFEREFKASQSGVPQGNDIMGRLVRASFNDSPQQRMKTEELFAFTFAGHETTSAALAWMFFELGRHPDSQAKLREEILAFKTSIGGRDVQASDFDSKLPYTTAVIKEVLRLYPVVPHIARRAGRDDTIPLSHPVITKSGSLQSSICIKKGQPVLISLWAYNRIQEIWGEDSDEWRPERFLDGKMDKNLLGMYGNLATFSSGVHSCIGWRFAVLELHAILVTLIEKFEFTLPDDGRSIFRTGISTVVPMVRGEEDKGVQLLMRVRPVPM